MNKIRVVVKNPGHDCEELDIEPTLEVFRSIVEGSIETCPCVGLTSFGGIMAYCNEVGKLIGLPKNFIIADRISRVYDIIVGAVVFFRNQGEEKISLTRHDIARIRNYVDVRSI